MGILEFIIGWLIADALSGVLHYVLDTKGSPDTPLIGQAVILHSRIHHHKPLEFTQWGFWDRHRNTWAVVIPLALLWFVCWGPSVILASAALGGMISPSVHYWAHRPSLAPQWVRFLQRFGAMQSPKGHALHHRPPYRRNYCVLTDWINRWL